MIRAVAGRELRSLFCSPLAWAILATTALIVGVLYLYLIDLFIQRQGATTGAGDVYGVTDWVIVPSLNLVGFIGLFVIPLITMRLVAEERRNGTLSLLLSAPVPIARIILGKFIAALAFAALLALIPAAMGLTLIGATSPDYGQWLAALLGTVLLLAAFIAVGLLASCLTDSPVLAAVIAYAALLLLWIIHLAAQGDGQTAQILNWLSPIEHQGRFQRGLVDTGDITYYLLITGLFLLLSIRRLDAERLQA
jgi:ABC-2 type transport system permease protein